MLRGHLLPLFGLIWIAAALPCGAEVDEADPLLIEARQAVRAGDAARAYELFGHMVRAHPDSELVNFELGIAALAAGKTSHAAIAFERALTINPDNDRTRIELARACFMMKQYQRSAQEFRTVLSHNPPDGVKENIASFLAKIEQAARKTWQTRITAQLAIGGVYDDNVNVGPDSQVIDIAPIMVAGSEMESLTVSEASLPVAAAGLLASATANGDCELGEEDAWGIIFGGSVYWSWLGGVASDWSDGYLALNGGARYASRAWAARLPVRVEHVQQGGSALLTIYGVSPSLVIVAGNKGETEYSATLAAEYRDYAELSDRDGSYFALCGVAGKAFGGGKRVVRVGATVFYEDCRAEAYANYGAEGFVEGEVRLPWRVALSASARCKGAWYSGRESLAPDDRADTRLQFGAGVRKSLGTAWSIDATYQFTDNESTFGLYDYGRNVVKLNVAYQL